ncbi:MAG: GNAT family N-acetyltransferase [Bacillota bacterium]|nr:GNAT family N-acetyltransferase [Bacillota bacterium]
MVTVKIAETEDQVSICKLLRYAVFIMEQNVTILRDHDEFDCISKDVKHYILYFGEFPVASARLRDIYGIAKLERVCVLSQFRDIGLGKALVDYIVDDAKNIGYKKIVLGSQVNSTPFYEKLGFSFSDDETFMDADIPHRHMHMNL